MRGRVVKSCCRVLSYSCSSLVRRFNDCGSPQLELSQPNLHTADKRQLIMSAVAVEGPPTVETKPPKQVTNVTWKEKKEAAVLRVKQKIGVEAMEAIKADWSILDAGNGKKDQEKGNEIIIALCNLKLSQIEILSMLGCGSERISKMRLRIAQGDDFVSRARKPPSHAFKEPTLKYLFDFMDQWETEVSVPCAEHNNKYIVETGITWKTLHERYQEGYSTLSPAMKEEIEFMKYSTFTQYIHHKNPGLSLTRPKLDVCLICAGLQAKDGTSSSGRICKADNNPAGAAPKAMSSKRKAAMITSEAKEKELEKDKDGSDSEDELLEPNIAAVPVEESTSSYINSDQTSGSSNMSSSSRLAGTPSVASQIRAIAAEGTGVKD